MSAVGNQRRILLRLLAELQPHWRTDRALPSRIQSVLSANRSFGSRDRRLYRELIYTTVRYLPWLESTLAGDPDRATGAIAWLAADLPATARFRAEAAADWPPPAPTLAGTAAIVSQRLGVPTPPPLPAWFREECPAIFESPEVDCILRRAPVWLRARAGGLEADLAAGGIASRRSAILPGAIEVLGESDVTRTAAFARGAFEVQDLGSQMILAAAGVGPGGRWLDACAGAGGKTLQLCELLGPAGSVDAHDIRADALAELRMRAARAGIQTSGETARLRVGGPPAGSYDGVLVDAPCSGSGTWRRAPHLKWSTTPEAIAGFAALQSTLLARFSAQVAPGGRLIYATCSLSRRENEEVVTGFLRHHPEFGITAPANTFGFAPGPAGMAILPARHDTDGFFVAALERRR